MCPACVAQGVTYVGGALAGLQVMAGRARARRRRDALTEPAAGPAADRPEGLAEAEHTVDAVPGEVTLV